jgi:hypothetical protein
MSCCTRSLSVQAHTLRVCAFTDGGARVHAATSDMMTAQRWLDLWGTTIKQALLGCKGAPTIVFDSRMVISDVEGSLAKLKALLERAGVAGLAMPDADEVQREVKAFIRTGPRKYWISQQMRERTGLSEKPVVDVSKPVMSTEQACTPVLGPITGVEPAYLHVSAAWLPGDAAVVRCCKPICVTRASFQAGLSMTGLVCRPAWSRLCSTSWRRTRAFRCTPSRTRCSTCQRLCSRTPCGDGLNSRRPCLLERAWLQVLAWAPGQASLLALRWGQAV